MKEELLLLMMMMGENQSGYSQVHVTAILGADETLFKTQFIYANHACQGGGDSYHHIPVM
jgi:hypothetical protein